MLKKIYSWLHRGSYSAGYWQEKVRQQALILCDKAKGKLLEVGCGEGLFLTRLATEYPQLEIWGIDSSNIRLKDAQAQLKQLQLKNVNLSLQEAGQLDFGAESFDRVVCINVIFNLQSRDTVSQVIQEFSRVCKKGGRLILDFRNAKNPLLYLKYKFAYVYDESVKTLPLKTYTLQDLQLLLNAAGFEIMHKVYIGFPVKKIAPAVILEAQKL